MVSLLLFWDLANPGIEPGCPAMQAKCLPGEPRVFVCLFVCLFVFNPRKQWHPTPVLLSGKFCGWSSLVGCSPWGRWELDTTERLHFHFSLSCIGEGNGTPLQCSCLENPRDGGAWWAAVCAVAQSQTRLKRLSSSSQLITTGFSGSQLSWLHYSCRFVFFVHKLWEVGRKLM